MHSKLGIISVLSLLFAGALIFSGCSKCSDDTDKASEDSTQAANEIKTPDIVILTPEQHITSHEPVNPETLLKPEKMNELLPQDVSRFEKYPWSGGYSEDRLQTWSSVSAEYVTEDANFFSLAIYDYGEGGYIADKQYLIELPQMPGMKTSRIELENGSGYIMWNDEKRSGDLFALIDNRFTIKIKAKNIPPETGSLEQILNMIEIDKLIAEGKKHPNINEK